MQMQMRTLNLGRRPEEYHSLAEQVAHRQDGSPDPFRAEKRMAGTERHSNAVPWTSRRRFFFAIARGTDREIHSTIRASPV